MFSDRKNILKTNPNSDVLLPCFAASRTFLIVAPHSAMHRTVYYLNQMKLYGWKVQSRFAETRFAKTLTQTLISANRVLANREDTGWNGSFPASTQEISDVITVSRIITIKPDENEMQFDKS